MMKRSIDLEKTLKSLDGQKYGAYKRTKGIYAFDQFHLAMIMYRWILCATFKMRLIIQRDVAKIPSDLLDEKDKRIAVSDFLTRAFGHQATAFNRTVKGSGKTVKFSSTIVVKKC